MKKLTIYTDGASRGNPGLAACAWIILDGLEVLEAESAGAGENTNNFAEYTALINALRSAKKYCTAEETELDVYSDSELMIRQVTGQYAVRSPSLKPLYSEVMRLSKDYAEVSYTHVPRENPYVSSCDWMCNQALDMLRKREDERRCVPKPVCTPVGIVHSPYKEKGSAPRQGRITNDISELEIYPEFSKALGGLSEGDDIFVLCWFDKSDRITLLTKPRGDSNESPRGVFSTRSPARPNPISLTLVKLLEINGNRLSVRGLEMYDGTPVLDIKPYYADIDSPNV